MSSPDFTPYAGLIAAAQSDPSVVACRKRLERAQQQRQLRGDVDLDDVIELLYTPLYYRMLLHTRPISPNQVAGILDLASEGLRPRRQSRKRR